jgi:hypothetical protein
MLSANDVRDVRLDMHETQEHRAALKVKPLGVLLLSRKGNIIEA